MMFEFADEVERLTDIRVAGVGGAGGNAIGRMIDAGLVGVEFLALNTDLQALNDCPAHRSMQIGSVLTSGLGSGGNPDVGQAAAEEDRDSIAKSLDGANMVFVTAGMGGGTGTGAAPVVAEVAKETGALTVGIVTKPFVFEGRVRMAQAERGIARLREAVDTLIVVPNQRLLEIVPPNTSMQEAYRIADNVLYEATRGIFEIISRHDHMNLDFADVCSVMRGMGEAMMGTGRAQGEGRAAKAAQEAISSPLLEDINIAGSQAVLVNVLGSEVQLHETAEAMQFIQDAAGPQAHVIFGYGVDETLEDMLQVTVIATGFQAGQAPLIVEHDVASAEIAPEPVMEVAEEEIPEDNHQPEAPAAEIAPDPVEAAAEEPAAEETPLEPAPENITALPPEEYEIQEREPDPLEAPPVYAEDEALDPGPDPREEDGLLRTGEAAAATVEPPFLAQEAASGGTEPTVRESTTAQNFLRPVGIRNIGEVEVPEAVAEPPLSSRAEASGLGPDNPGDDRNAPAYIRKYMD